MKAKEQDYILKKYVRATCISHALDLDKATDVTEVFIVADKPDRDYNPSAIGFQMIYPEE